MSDQTNKDVILKDFFKRNVLINELEEVLRFKPETLIGVDKVSSDQLLANGIKTIGELASLSVANLPEIKNILPSMLQKWIRISQIIQKNVQEQLRRHKKLNIVISSG